MTWHGFRPICFFDLGLWILSFFLQTFKYRAPRDARSAAASIFTKRERVDNGLCTITLVHKIYNNVLLVVGLKKFEDFDWGF